MIIHWCSNDCHKMSEWCEKVFWLEQSWIMWTVLSLVRRWAGAGPRQPEALPSGRHHEPDPSETFVYWQKATGSLPVLGFGEDPRGWRVRCGATYWRSPCEAPQVSAKPNWTLVSCNLLREPLQNLPSSMTVCVAAVAVAAEGERELGWGRVRIFLHRLGKTVDSRSLSLAHCDLTATDLLELGG